jgi:hypothetical protein
VAGVGAARRLENELHYITKVAQHLLPVLRAGTVVNDHDVTKRPRSRSRRSSSSS